MKSLLFFLFSTILISATAQNKIEEAQDFQDELDMEFGDDKLSPLIMEDYAKFDVLPFFEIDTNFYVIATLALTPNDSMFKMKTTTTRLPEYRRYAVATFTINGENYKLNIYESLQLKTIDEYKNHLFLPFKDLTTGNQTYGGGRFIDLEKTEGQTTIIIDFNRAYNPLCAYNERYSCPIVPVENFIEVEILAGVMAPENH